MRFWSIQRIDMNRLILILVVGFASFCVSPAFADDGAPIAVRHWGDGQITIETMWGYHVGLGVQKETESKLPSKVDIEMSSKTAAEDSTALLRKPNEDKVSLISPKDMDSAEKRACVCNVITPPTDTAESGLIVGHELRVDGAIILDLNQGNPAEIAAHVLVRKKEPHLLVIANAPAFTAEVCQSISAKLKPAMMIVPESMATVGDAQVKKVAHNTVCFSSSKDKKGKTTFVSLGSKPYKFSAELEALMLAKEKSCKASRALFASLSIEQMNFKPSNGTHTPRWNTEHMMGRELLFFSQIYHAVDPSIPVMNLNPKQMPKDYQFAHPDWTGTEEARQTERVEKYTRRFGYLLDGLPLGRRAPGSRSWSPKSLLKQMERHYTEHTANVRKKMNLDEWPQ